MSLLSVAKLHDFTFQIITLVLWQVFITDFNRKEELENGCDRGIVGEWKASMLNSNGNRALLDYLCCLWFVSAQSLKA